MNRAVLGAPMQNTLLLSAAVLSACVFHVNRVSALDSIKLSSGDRVNIYLTCFDADGHDNKAAVYEIKPEGGLVSAFIYNSTREVVTGKDSSGYFVQDVHKDAYAYASDWTHNGSLKWVKARINLYKPYKITWTTDTGETFVHKCQPDRPQ